MSPTGDASDIEEAFRIWVNKSTQGNRLSQRGAIIKQGRRVLKTATYSTYGNAETGEVRQQELRFRAYDQSRAAGLDLDDPNPNSTWYCQNDEIERLAAFIGTEVTETSRYRLVDTHSPAADLLDLLRDTDLSAEALAQALVEQGDVGKLIGLLAESESGLTAAEAAVVARRRGLVNELRSVVEDPATNETQIQRLIGDAYWIFGGRYVGVAERRNLAVLDQHDIPLLTADGTLHIIELKGSNISRLIHPHRNHHIVGNEVHEATSQAINYVRSLDELGSVLSTTYRNELGLDYDLRRVFATVVIGHPKHCSAYSARQIKQTLRTYNAHLSRVEVITYMDLVELRLAPWHSRFLRESQQ